jgi:hypothetical protein
MRQAFCIPIWQKEDSLMSNNPQRDDAQERNQKEGLQVTTPRGENVTIGPAADPRYKGADFVSNTDPSGEKETAIIDQEGNTLNTKK